MTTKEIKNHLEVIKNTLSYMLVEGDKKGKEISHAYEAGLYIGTIRATILELEDILRSNMSNNKQSSVEWLISQLNKKGFAPVVTDDEIEQAKVMHRKEILEARQNGLDNQFANGSWDSQLYYELEFGGEK